MAPEMLNGTFCSSFSIDNVNSAEISQNQPTFYRTFALASIDVLMVVLVHFFVSNTVHVKKTVL